MKSKKILNFLMLITTVSPFLTSCDSGKDTQVKTPEVSAGVFVLNEGQFEKNNASLTYYDFTTGFGSNDIFLDKNNRGLGDTGQDMIKYGSKLYIAVYGSNTIEVVDAASGISLKSFSLQSPRSLTAANGKVYIVQFDGHVAQMDTTTYAIDKTIAVGPGPNKSVIANAKLYVANSGSFAAKDSTISVINLSTFSETKKIVVNLNPYGEMQADSYGNVYIVSNGNYSNIPGKFQRIEAGTDKVTDINIPVQGFVIEGDNAYIFNYSVDFSTWQAAAGTSTITVYDVKNEKKLNDNIITSSSVELTPYSIAVNPITKDIYLGTTDYSTKGKMYCFDSTGKSKFSFSTGISPSKTVFISKK
jgi:YVTN family beta-propeller protein